MRNSVIDMSTARVPSAHRRYSFCREIQRVYDPLIFIWESKCRKYLVFLQAFAVVCERPSQVVSDVMTLLPGNNFNHFCRQCIARELPS